MSESWKRSIRNAIRRLLQMHVSCHQFHEPKIWWEKNVHEGFSLVLFLAGNTLTYVATLETRSDFLEFRSASHALSPPLAPLERGQCCLRPHCSVEGGCYTVCTSRQISSKWAPADKKSE